MSRFASLLRRTFGVMKEHVGTDHLGNKYYSIPEQKTWTGKLKSSVISHVCKLCPRLSKPPCLC